MKFISHRGNINGPRPADENHPTYIEAALNLGYDVEIDVWKVGPHLWLGHDNPTHDIDKEFLMDDRLLCHAKNLEALDLMLKNDNIHCFWHQEDHYTLTSRGYVVSFPGYATTSKTICMKPELIDAQSVSSCYAICSDYIESWE